LRNFLWLTVSALGSLAFQLSVALWPGKLAQYAWLVKYVWMAWFVFLLSWLLTHEKVLGRKMKKFWGVEDDERGQPQPFIPTIPLVENKQELNQTGFKFEQHIHSPTATPVPVPVSKPLYTPPPQPKHRIRFLGPATISLNTTKHNYQEWLIESEKLTDLQGIIVTFRNDTAMDQVKTIPKAGAHLSFFGKNGKEIGSGISTPCWLTREANEFEIELAPGGSSGKLLVLASLNGAFAIPHIDERVVHWGRGYVPVLESQAFEEMPTAIEVRLKDSYGTQLIPTISLRITAFEGKLKAETESA